MIYAVVQVSVWSGSSTAALQRVESAKLQQQSGTLGRYLRVQQPAGPPVAQPAESDWGVWEAGDAGHFGPGEGRGAPGAGKQRPAAAAASDHSESGPKWPKWIPISPIQTNPQG